MQGGDLYYLVMAGSRRTIRRHKKVIIYIFYFGIFPCGIDNFKVSSESIYNLNYKNMAKKLAIARVSSGYSQQYVAEKFNKTQSYISKIESGITRLDVVQLASFAKLYKRDISFFVSEIEK